ncbi:hypothetical protein GQ600_27084 [Phytophthora cactorum]|nr:hypothetical protein GQ600_27084 [Phytophthora cactorum]
MTMLMTSETEGVEHESTYLVSRKPTSSTRVHGRSAAPRAGAKLTLTTADRGFVEFHPSMSLENAPTLADCFAVSSEITASTNANTQPLSAPDANDSTLESVLADRLHVWTKVTEVRRYEYGSANEDDIDIDPPNANDIEWQEEQERHLDIADYDIMDLIELSEHFS